MINFEALSIANAIALLANSLAFGALWRALRDSRWAHVGLTALVVSAFDVVDSRSMPTAHPALSGVVLAADGMNDSASELRAMGSQVQNGQEVGQAPLEPTQHKAAVGVDFF